MTEERAGWRELRERRMSEPGAGDAYEAAQLAFALGARVRHLRDSLGWSQTELARRAGLTQPAVARFEAGGTVPTLLLLHRLARALGAPLTVEIGSSGPPPTRAVAAASPRKAPTASTTSPTRRRH